GGGIDWGGSHSLTVKSSLLANNGMANCQGYSAGALSAGDNLSDDSSCSAFFTSAGDLNSTSAGLDPAGLRANGGPTQTVALLSTSPAVNAIPVSFCTDADGNPATTDQRGVPRPRGIGCDIGAFERYQSGFFNTEAIEALI